MRQQSQLGGRKSQKKASRFWGWAAQFVDATNWSPVPRFVVFFFVLAIRIRMSIKPLDTTSLSISTIATPFSVYGKRGWWRNQIVCVSTTGGKCSNDCLPPPLAAVNDCLWSWKRSCWTTFGGNSKRGAQTDNLGGRRAESSRLMFIQQEANQNKDKEKAADIK